MTLGLRLGQEAYRLRLGELKTEAFVKRAGQHIGALSGILAGTALGWSLGRAFPGAGAIVGAFGGGLLGQVGGEHVGRVAASRLSTALAAELEEDPEPVAEAEGPHETHEEPPVADTPPEDESVQGFIRLPRRVL